MSEAFIERPLPPLPRIVAGLLVGSFVPYVLFFALLIKAPALGNDPGAGLLTFLALAGQALIIAVPIGLSRWPRMKRPLAECMLIAALTGPGPLGYLAILVAVAAEPGTSLVGLALGLVLPLMLLGALGGAIFWAIATTTIEAPGD